MKKLLIAVPILIAVVVAWRIGAVYLANDEFATDVQNLAAQNRARDGSKSIDTEDDLKEAVIDSAQQHGVPLAPDHITVHRTLTPGRYDEHGTLEAPAMLDVSIATDYDAPVNLLVFSFNIHFAPASEHSAPVLL
jgi:hypothetical protein